MEIVLGVVVLAFLAVLLVGVVTGRVKAQSCCSLAAPPAQDDLRLRGTSTPTSP